jgi:hypothetical protein
MGKEMERLMKTTKNLTQGSRSSGRHRVYFITKKPCLGKVQNIKYGKISHWNINTDPSSCWIKVTSMYGHNLNWFIHIHIQKWCNTICWICILAITDQVFQTDLLQSYQMERNTEPNFIDAQYVNQIHNPCYETMALQFNYNYSNILEKLNSHNLSRQTQKNQLPTAPKHIIFVTFFEYLHCFMVEFLTTSYLFHKNLQLAW